MVYYDVFGEFSSIGFSESCTEDGTQITYTEIGEPNERKDRN